MTIAPLRETLTEQLLEPFAIGSLELRNRVVMAPMTREFAPGGVPTSDTAAYYARRAQGGVGLIVTEGTVVGAPASAASPRVPRFHGDDALTGWKAVADAVHAAGGRIVPQLWHVGLDRDPEASAEPGVPSRGPGTFFGPRTTAARAMTQADIDDVVRAFGDAAAHAEALGFDGVEIHGAHGYLIDQFLWASTNQRIDGYGGSLDRRLRFAQEIVAEVRRRVTADFPVLFRFSQWKTIEFTARPFETPADLEAVLTPLADAGVNAFHASTRRFWEPAFEGSADGLATWTKRVTGLPTIAVGSAGLEGSDFVGALLRGEGAEPASLALLAEQIGRGDYDLIAFGRALISDPALVNKIAGVDPASRAVFDARDLQKLT